MLETSILSFSSIVFNLFPKEFVLILYTILILTHQQDTGSKNITGKGEIARYEQFLLFPQ